MESPAATRNRHEVIELVLDLCRKEAFLRGYEGSEYGKAVRKDDGAVIIVDICKTR